MRAINALAMLKRLEPLVFDATRTHNREECCCVDCCWIRLEVLKQRRRALLKEASGA